MLIGAGNIRPDSHRSLEGRLSGSEFARPYCPAALRVYLLKAS